MGRLFPWFTHQAARTLAAIHDDGGCEVPLPELWVLVKPDVEWCSVFASQCLASQLCIGIVQIHLERGLQDCLPLFFLPRGH